MSNFVGTPSDEVPEVLATGRTDVTTIFVSMSARDPDGRDADYIAWHSLDHRPEQYRLAALRGSLRLVSTPACRAARAASDERYDGVDHVMTYLFADPAGLRPFGALGAALGAAGRMPRMLPSVEMGVYDLAGRVASRRAVVGADVVPWRPARGVYLLVERVDGGPAPAADLAEVPGVAGAWWYTGTPDAPPTVAATRDLQITYVYLDDEPAAVAARLRGPVEKRWAGGGATPLLAAPFHTITPFEWDRFLP
jgi:hypothetical protein